MYELCEDGVFIEHPEDGFSPSVTIDLEPHPRADRTSAFGSRRVTDAAAPLDGAAGTADAEDVERAARRRRGKVRRWCVANRAGWLMTLTYRGEGQFEWPMMARDVWNFRRQMRRRFPGVKAALMTVPEWHPGGHGLHVHVATSEYVPKELLAACWPHGFVDNGERTHRGGSSPRQLAGYVSKYLSKEHEGAERPRGAHGYEVTQGTQPEAWRVSGLGQGGVEAAIRGLMGDPSYTWDSRQVEGWRGPPAAFLAWDDVAGSVGLSTP
jgi:hypothetical protein